MKSSLLKKKISLKWFLYFIIKYMNKAVRVRYSSLDESRTNTNRF